MPKNIVILTMSLDIGGAETHIMELAMALKARGENVTVFSNGGSYVPVLTAHGITHIKAPMNSKRISSLLRCTRILSDFCKANHVSVIHSHTRITNFIAHRICRKFHLPMVTTVHFNFKINFFTKLFSHWGLRALAVSEDLKEYVVNGYDFDPEKVRVTVNGTNLETFCPGNNPEMRASFGFTEENKVILCVSRIDHGACENVFRFLESAEEIYKACPHARIVIVGNGNRFTQLQALAQKINQATEKNYIQLAGAQTNIADYCHAADIFAGVSRSALEAIACKLPTLLIGNSGYLGVYSDKVRKACIDTNFTYRGYGYVSAHEVAEIVIHMIQKPEDFSESIEKAYELVKQRYSVSAMAEDALTSYKEAEQDMRPYDIMISGYYGTYNFGDDVTLKTIIENIQARFPLQRVILLSHTTENPYKDARFTVIHRFDLRRILPLMKKTKLFMLGGGSLLQDVTSNRSLFFYLFMLRHAQKYGCKTMIYANGIGPVRKKHHQQEILRLLKKADCITLRDRISYKFLLSNGFTETEMRLTADETYSYRLGSVAQRTQVLPELPDKPIFLINLRNYENMPKSLTDDLAAALNQFCAEAGLFPVLMPVQFAQDYRVLCDLSERLTVPHYLYKERISNSKIIHLIHHCDFLLTERLHPIIFAAKMQKPFAAVAYDPKVSAVTEQLNMEKYTLLPAVLSQQTVQTTLRMLLTEKNDIPARLEAAVKQLEAASEINSILASELLEQ